MQINRNGLLKLGWQGALPDEPIARVVGEEKSLYRLQISPAETFSARITGKFRHEAKSRADYPAVGDWVTYTMEGEAFIDKVLPRKSSLVRKVAGEKTEEQIIATNIDYVMIAVSCNQNFNVARIERYLTLAWNSGAKPLVLLTKSDLAENLEDFIEEIQRLSPHIEICATSSLNDYGIEQLRRFFLPNRTNVIMGSSGVGKSSLTNKLLGEDRLKTQEIRDEDGKGKHTTTSRYLLLLPDGGMIIDTPGMREVQVLDVQEGLEAQFEDIEDLQLKCKFSDCKHESEPKCAIKEALANGSLDKDHWLSYLKLKREVEHAKSKTDKALAAQRKKAWKKAAEEAFEASRKNKK